MQCDRVRPASLLTDTESNAYIYVIDRVHFVQGFDSVQSRARYALGITPFQAFLEATTGPLFSKDVDLSTPGDGDEDSSYRHSDDRSLLVGFSDYPSSTRAAHRGLRLLCRGRRVVPTRLGQRLSILEGGR